MKIDAKKPMSSRARRGLRLAARRAVLLFSATNPLPLTKKVSKEVVARRAYQNRHVVGRLVGSEPGPRRRWINAERRASVGC